MDIEQQTAEIKHLSEVMKAAIKDDDWLKATDIFQQRDEKIHQLFSATEALSDKESQILRDMIIEIQSNDKLVIDKIVVQRDKLLSDVLEASNSQKALEAYAKNI